MPRIQRALISVYDKRDLIALVKTLRELEVEILSTGGTAQFLQQYDIPFVQVSEYVEYPEILGGRVKTLHPRILGGILFRRDNPEHLKEAQNLGVKPIDLVVVNLYPFEQVVSQGRVPLDEALETIDIGGVSLLRAAAKNYPWVVALCDPAQYGPLQRELREKRGEISTETSRRFAQMAFARTAVYDQAIAYYLEGLSPSTPEELPTFLPLGLQKAIDLRYGENPHQKGAFYHMPLWGQGKPFWQIQGPPLSYNNLLDVHSVVRVIGEFDQTCVAIVKHNNPCGVALGGDGAEAYRRARETDPLSAYGGVVGVNRPVDRHLAETLRDDFLEVLVAPDFEEEPLDILSAKKRLRLLKFHPNIRRGFWDVRSVMGGFLIQEPDQAIWNPEKLQVVTRREPTPQEWRALEFAWKVVKHVKSNAIVFTGTDRTLGIGAGQMSRVDAVQIAVQKAEKSGLSLEGSVVASDAFFPFRDGVDVAARAGATAVIQPGGSIRDGEVIEAANEHNLAMVFTSMRHFRH